MLDADIVFISPFIDRLLPVIEQNDYVVSIEKETDPYAEWVKGIYFDTKKLNSFFRIINFPVIFSMQARCS